MNESQNESPFHSLGNWGLGKWRTTCLRSLGPWQWQVSDGGSDLPDFGVQTLSCYVLSPTGKLDAVFLKETLYGAVRFCIPRENSINNTVSPKGLVAPKQLLFPICDNARLFFTLMNDQVQVNTKPLVFQTNVFWFSRSSEGPRRKFTLRPDISTLSWTSDLSFIFFFGTPDMYVIWKK